MVNMMFRKNSKSDSVEEESVDEEPCDKIPPSI